MIDPQKLIGEWRLIDSQMTISGKTEKTFDASR